MRRRASALLLGLVASCQAPGLGAIPVAVEEGELLVLSTGTRELLVGREPGGYRVFRDSLESQPEGALVPNIPFHFEPPVHAFRFDRRIFTPRGAERPPETLDFGEGCRCALTTDEPPFVLGDGEACAIPSFSTAEAIVEGDGGLEARPLSGDAERPALRTRTATTCCPAPDFDPDGPEPRAPPPVYVEVPDPLRVALPIADDVLVLTAAGALRRIGAIERSLGQHPALAGATLGAAALAEHARIFTPAGPNTEEHRVHVERGEVSPGRLRVHLGTVEVAVPWPGRGYLLLVDRSSAGRYELLCPDDPVLDCVARELPSACSGAPFRSAALVGGTFFALGAEGHVYEIGPRGRRCHEADDLGFPPGSDLSALRFETSRALVCGVLEGRGRVAVSTSTTGLHFVASGPSMDGPCLGLFGGGDRSVALFADGNTLELQASRVDPGRLGDTPFGAGAHPELPIPERALELGPARVVLVGPGGVSAHELTGPAPRRIHGADVSDVWVTGVSTPAGPRLLGRRFTIHDGRVAARPSDRPAGLVTAAATSPSGRVFVSEDTGAGGSRLHVLDVVGSGYRVLRELPFGVNSLAALDDDTIVLTDRDGRALRLVGDAEPAPIPALDGRRLRVLEAGHGAVWFADTANPGAIVRASAAERAIAELSIGRGEVGALRSFCADQILVGARSLDRAQVSVGRGSSFEALSSIAPQTGTIPLALAGPPAGLVVVYGDGALRSPAWTEPVLLGFELGAVAHDAGEVVFGGRGWAGFARLD